MERILDQSDLDFIAVQRGIEPKMVSKLRSERRKIFRGYLRSLRFDYARVSAALNLIMVGSGVDRPDLAKLLLQNKILFTKTLMRVEFQLALHGLGVGTVQVGGLIEALEAMRQQLQGVGVRQFSATA